MFFKTKVSVSDYCNVRLTRLFSREREATWDDLRTRCNDASLNQVDAHLYYNHLRAVMLQLMSIAITKTQSDFRVRGDSSVCVDNYLEKHRLTELDSLSRQYNRAFGSSYTDGIQQIVSLFAEHLTNSKMGQPTRQQFYTEFYAILQTMFEEFKSIKLVTAN